MKKFLSLLGVVLIFGVVVSCVDDNPNTSVLTTPVTTATSNTTISTTGDMTLVKVTEAKTALVLEGLDNVENRIVLPGKGLHDTTITWVSSNPEYITNAGAVTRPTHEIGNKQVTLTATIKLGTVQETKDFVATVIALPNPVLKEPSLMEKFDYEVGSFLDEQTEFWKVDKGGYTGKIVDNIPGHDMPTPRALQLVEAAGDTHYHRAIEVKNVTILEFFFIQINEGAGVNLEFLDGGNRVFSIGLDRNNEFKYRKPDTKETGCGAINPGTWYQMRLEIDVIEAKYKLFYYDYATDTSLVELTPAGGVGFAAGLTAVNVLRIRTKNPPIANTYTYLTDLVINEKVAFEPKAKPNPNPTKGIGKIVGFNALTPLLVGETFTDDTLVVYNNYKLDEVLVKDTDYTLEITGDVDTNVEGEYTRVYTISLIGREETRVLTKTVTVSTPAEPNVIKTLQTTTIKANAFTVKVNLEKIDGKLYYVVVPTGSDAPTAEEIKAGVNYGSVTLETFGSENLTSINETISITVSGLGYDAYFVVENTAGFSNVVKAKKIYDFIAVSTPSDLDAMNASGSSERFVLMNDIDGTGYTWVGSTSTFKGTFDGQGHTIKNFTLNHDDKQNGGFFHITDGATIKNVNFENIIVNSSKRSGIVIGDMRGTTVTNIKITNSKINIDGESYTGIVAGRASGAKSTVTFVNVINCETKLTSAAAYAGGFIGYAESELLIQDVYCQVKVTEAGTAAQMAGGLLGRVGTNATNIVVDRVVLDVNVNGVKNIGGFVGKQEGKLHITNSVLFGSVTITSGSNKNAGSISGNGAVTTLTNVFEVDFTGTLSSGIQAPVENRITAATVNNADWWTTNMSTFDFVNTWEFVDGRAILK